ncbi:MAG: hypothetical protein PUJ40_01470 [bacterium]|nr:hypothetical protein [bacterium]
MTSKKPLLLLAASFLLLSSCGPEQPSSSQSSESHSPSSSVQGGAEATESSAASSSLEGSPSSSEESLSASETPSSSSMSNSEEASSEFVSIEASSEPLPEPSSSESSSEGSEETSSEEELPHSLSIDASGFSVDFLESKSSYYRGDRVEFTLRAYGNYYKLNSVYYAPKGLNYPRTVINADESGLYSFLMPGEDITLHVDSERLYSVSFSGSHFTATLNQKADYYAQNTKLEFTLEIEEGYMLIDEPSGTYLSIASEGSGTNLLSITKVSDLHYSFYVPQGNVTISVPVEEKPVLDESDPFKKEAHYVGTFHNYDDCDYYSTLYFDFPGDGTLDWRMEWYYVSDDWGGDLYQARPTLSGHVKFETSATEVAFSYSKKKYSFDAETSKLTFSSPGRIATSGDETWVLNVSSARNADGLPTSLIFTQQIANFSQFEKSAGTVLNLK